MRLLCLQNFKTLFFSLCGLILVTAMCSKYPYPPAPPMKGNGNSEGMGKGIQKEAIFKGVGACYRGLFPGVLSEIGELAVFQNEYYNLFA